MRQHEMPWQAAGRARQNAGEIALGRVGGRRYRPKAHRGAVSGGCWCPLWLLLSVVVVGVVVVVVFFFCCFLSFVVWCLLPVCVRRRLTHSEEV